MRVTNYRNTGLVSQYTSNRTQFSKRYNPVTELFKTCYLGYYRPQEAEGR